MQDNLYFLNAGHRLFTAIKLWVSSKKDQRERKRKGAHIPPPQNQKEKQHTDESSLFLKPPLVKKTKWYMLLDGKFAKVHASVCTLNQ